MHRRLFEGRHLVVYTIFSVFVKNDVLNTLFCTFIFRTIGSTCVCGLFPANQMFTSPLLCCCQVPLMSTDVAEIFLFPNLWHSLKNTQQPSIVGRDLWCALLSLMCCVCAFLVYLSNSARAHRAIIVPCIWLEVCVYLMFSPKYFNLRTHFIFFSERIIFFFFCTLKQLWGLKVFFCCGKELIPWSFIVV